MDKILGFLALLTGGIVLIILLACILAWPVQLLWNGCLVDAINGINPIGFWQALGLLILSSILFKPTNSSSK